jgi:hypothetical protein
LAATCPVGRAKIKTKNKPNLVSGSASFFDRPDPCSMEAQQSRGPFELRLICSDFTLAIGPNGNNSDRAVPTYRLPAFALE